MVEYILHIHNRYPVNLGTLQSLTQTGRSTYLADAYSNSLSASDLCCFPVSDVVALEAGSALVVESDCLFKILICMFPARETRTMSQLVWVMVAKQ